MGVELGMRRAGIPKQLVDMLVRMDKNNKTYVRTGQWEEHRHRAAGYTAERGAPQGSVESPGEFILFLDILMTALEAEGVKKPG